MSRASDSMKSIPREKRPFGYIVVESSTENLDPSMHGVTDIHLDYCEIALQFRLRSASVFCQITDDDRVNHVYAIAVFEDEDAERLIALANVSYNPRVSDGGVKPTISVFSANLHKNAVGRIIRFIHVVVSESILANIVPAKKDGSGDEPRWYLPFDRKRAQRLVQLSGESIESMIALFSARQPEL